MLKNILLLLILITITLHANTTNIEDGKLKLLSACDTVYEQCAEKCIKPDGTDDIPCYTKCEALYDECEQTKIFNELKNKSVD